MADPLDRMRTAWKSSGRLALHQEAEALAAEGTTREALESAVDALLLEARAAGADDETEEEIMGVGDRLSGWCNPSSRIITREVHQPTPTNGVHLPIDRPVSPA